MSLELTPTKLYIHYPYIYEGRDYTIPLYSMDVRNERRPNLHYN